MKKKKSTNCLRADLLSIMTSTICHCWSIPWNTSLFFVPRLQPIIRYLYHHLYAYWLCFSDSFLSWCSPTLVPIESSLIQSIDLVVSHLILNNYYIKLCHIILLLDIFLLIFINSCCSLVVISVVFNHYWLWSIYTVYTILNYIVKLLILKYTVVY